MTQDVVTPGKKDLVRRFRGKLNAGAPAPSSKGEKKKSVGQALQFGATRRALKRGRESQLLAVESDAAKASDGLEGNDEGRREALEKRMKVMRYVGAKTFYPSAGIWYDSSYDSKKQPTLITLTVGGQKYFEAIRKHPRITKYLALGNVVFKYKGTWYKMTLPKK